MNALVRQDACRGCGSCSILCPDVFRVEEGTAKVMTVQVAPSFVASCCAAAGKCPAHAIVLGKAQAVMLAGRQNDKPYWVAL